ncbi:MAG: hypothetical protein CMJ46_01355 [Planctomyces sp.]|nr:hypothetical protein [Planctomyces sp.]
MGNVASRFSAEEHERVNQAVQHAESMTAAEIVPVIAGSSGRYDRAEDIVGLWLAGLLIVLAWFFYPLPENIPGDWSGAHPIWQLVAILLAGLVGFILGVVLGMYCLPLRRLFTPAAQMREEVDLRARQIFYDNRVHHTTGASGVLLYISCYEHLATVVADQQVLDKIDQAGVDGICAEFSRRLQTEPMIDALCGTIKHVGERLATDLPATSQTTNELPDALVVME